MIQVHSKIPISHNSASPSTYNSYVLQCHTGTLLLLKPVSKVHREDPPRQYSENPGSKVDFSPDLCMVKVHGQSTGHTLVTGSGSDKIIYASRSTFQ
eukprot:SAG11_NODE_1804_length_4234_cov_20.948730_4_plen_97_part_00